MNKMISFAKIMFAGLGIYLSIGIVRSMMASFLFIVLSFSWANMGILVASLCIYLAVLVAVIQLLILKRDKWAHKLIAKDIQPDQPLNIDLTLTMAFRLVSVGAGIFCLNSFVWIASQSMRNLIMTMRYNHLDGQMRQMFSKSFSVDYIQPLLYLALAVYLLCGAPHFVRWQVKKTLQLCDNSKDN